MNKKFVCQVGNNKKKVVFYCIRSEIHMDMACGL
jgi:hypothetical protein